ncbi:MAG TPA: ATP-binding protein, partial [Pyrinomonadaceae bacterium]|nr:ATP-binding protein [Pyrinomonadaceae bacterium]
MSIEEKLPPNFSKLDIALRSIGYSFEVAIADIIDNAIDAQAKNVLVRFIIKRDAPLDVVISDDGWGMDKATLKEAMRFGADVSEQLDRLGKFGLGLKLASLSQARELKVYSLQGGKLCGRGWLEEGITRGFTSSVFDQGECEAGLQQVGLQNNLERAGTAVLWSRLYRVGHSHSAPEEHVQRLIHRLKDYLGLAFHRFLERQAKQISITIDMFDAESGKTGVPVFLKALDPFGYGSTGHKS